MRRRELLGAGLAIAGLAAGPPAVARATVRRVSWTRFVGTPAYDVLARTISSMLRNPDPRDPNSWEYWAEIHQTDCPHGQPYFLAWHRGYLARFEARLRVVSGDTTLAVPYWDYFTDPEMPEAFKRQGTPFFHWNRTNTNVADALGYGFTDPALVDFQRGARAGMEPSIEQWPHNRVHSLIGGTMGGFLSPRDPIFWLHHANVDRLWRAWTRAGGGRAMPPRTDPYWSGEFTYGAETPLPRLATYDTVDLLGYDYDVETLPTPSFQAAPPPPRVRSLPLVGGGMTQQRTLSLVESQGSLVLDDRSFTVRVPLDSASRDKLAGILAPLVAAPPPPPPAGTETPPPVSLPAFTPQVSIVLTDVALTDVGRQGGFFYNVFVNLPASGRAPEATRLVGSFGPFEVATATHGDHGHARIVFPATEVLRDLPRDALRRLTVSFVRVDGPIAPRGPAITIGGFSVEISGEDDR